MKKLIIQIPCFNEEDHLPATVADLPKHIEGIDVIERLVIDDGSTDRTSEVAKKLGVEHVIRFPVNKGLASAFRAGLQEALENDADIIVNTDADNQYRGADIAKIVKPILDGRADMVIGDRQIWSHPEFGIVKKCLQKFGSWVVGQLAGKPVADVTSGFRAFDREAAIRLNVLSNYTYTQETIIQAGQHKMGILSVPVQTNPTARPSRLFHSIPAYVRRSGATIVRVYTFYRALKVFTYLASIPFIIGCIVVARFLVYYFAGEGSGHVQSLILSGVMFNLSFMLFILGVLADLIGSNRRLMEEVLVQVKKLGLKENGRE